MKNMFSRCDNLHKDIKNNSDMFYDCKDLSPNTINEILGKKK